MFQPCGNLGCPGLAIPQPELLEVKASPLLNRADKIFAGRRLAIVALKIEVGAFAELLRPGHGPHHADHFGALVIDRRGIEVRDLLKRIRPDRMRERPRIFRELRRAQNPHILDPLNRFAAHRRAEHLVAQHGEAFLQGKLEPVATGHPIARPVVEILMADHRFDPVKIAVGRGFLIGEDIARVEHVEPLVLHRPHVEIRNRNDVEQVEIVLAPEGLFVPFHRMDQAAHRMAGAALIASADIDAEIDLAAVHRCEAVPGRHQLTCHKREQIGRLGPGIVPFRPVRAALTFSSAITRSGAIAVRQQHGKRRLVAAHPHGVN